MPKETRHNKVIRQKGRRRGTRSTTPIVGNRRNLLLLGLASSVLIGALVTVILSHRDASARPSTTLTLTATVASVNGLAIPVREMNLFIAQERAATFAYFKQQDGVDDNAQFWSTAYGGQTPQDYIKKAALADISKVTVQQQLAHQYGLLPDPSYGAFVHAWLQENARRRQALANHQIIYGPIQYTETNYFTYVFDQITYDLKQLLAQRGIIGTSDTVLYPYYLAHQAVFQQAPASATGRSQSTLVTPPFTQIRGEVEQRYVDDQYATLVSNLTNQAHVVINQAVYNVITIS